MKSVATVALVVATVAACSISGEPTRTPDLTGKAAPAGAFTYGPGLPVQDPGIVSDITFRNRSRVNTPPECTPAAVENSTAQIRVGPGGPAGGTLTAMVVLATDSFDDFVAQVNRCEKFTLGGTVGTTVSTRIDDEQVAGTVRVERQIQMGPPSADSAPPTTAVTEFVAQEGDVRVYVQNRRSGLEPLGDDELTATRTLFDAARVSAFGS